ncbi:MAG: gliding motility-associated C-terminal domain-containing protein, partial [Bacteroidota bacterium]|nr:gliding motility-associated C-terminal domain-containing protein [Bacteroidota bacterium]
MTKNIHGFLLILALICAPVLIKAQVNDSPCDAINLGFLPSATPCGSGGGVTFGSVVNQFGDNTGATNDTLTGFMTSCYSGPSLHDVWYKFIPTETHLEMMIQGTGTNPLDTVYVGIYEALTGECIAMLPRACATRDGVGPHLIEFGPVTFGISYYLQISSKTYTGDGAFSFSLRSKNICQDCLKSSALQAFPPPAAAAYPPDTTIAFCYTIAGFDEQNGNRLHGVVPLFGSGWDATTLSIISSADSADFFGTWKWFSNIDINGSIVSGYFYDIGGDNDPRNNRGDQGGFTTFWTFCFKIRTQTKALCDGGVNDLSIRFLTYSDGESGSLITTSDCGGDEDYVLETHMKCCEKLFAVPFAASCNNTATGSIQAYGGPVSLFGYDYYLYDSNGNLINTATTTGTYTSPPLSEGYYNLVTNVNTSTFCSSSMITYVPGAIDYDVRQINYACGGMCLNQAQITMISGSADSVIWNGSPGSLTSPNLCNGWNYFTIVDTALNCSITDSVLMFSFPDIDPEFNYDKTTYCTSEGFAIITDFPAIAGGVFSIVGPIPGAVLDPSTGIVDISGAGSGMLVIKYNSGPPCNRFNLDTIYLNASPPPVSIYTDQSLCPGEPHFIFPNSLVEPIHWYSDSSLSSLIAVQSPGTGYDPLGSVSTPPGSQFTFFVTQSNSSGCESLPKPITITFFNSPSVVASADVTICPGFAVNLGVTGGNSFSWMPPGLLDDPASASPLANPGQTTVFTVFGTDLTSGCTSSDSMIVVVDSSGSCDIQTYSGFTPNMDGNNDYWHIDGISIDKQNNVTIFNRWGDKIWE